WRRKMADALEVPEGGLVLDAACGTGDVMAELLDRKKKIRVAGIDFSEKMLALAKRKAEASGRDTFFLAAADVLLPPFAPNTFDAATIAFGIRNIADRKKALEIFSGLLRPGGMLAVLELATPSGKMMRKLYLAYFTKILPAIGGLFSKNIKAYRYLPASVIGFPAPQ
ncbi:MAG: class I SAM-dependent methyltransferase, partial [Desulfosalsimonas sp.]